MSTIRRRFVVDHSTASPTNFSIRVLVRSSVMTGCFPHLMESNEQHGAVFESRFSFCLFVYDISITHYTKLESGVFFTVDDLAFDSNKL